MGDQIREIELDLLLEALYRRWGYDFRDYARASIRRRVHNAQVRHGMARISDLIPRIMHDQAFFRDVLTDFSVTVTQMFRDPDVFQALRAEVVPWLRTWPYIKIWHAGCATGEEVYSLGIILLEEGLLERTTIYATDINEASLMRGREGIYHLKDAVDSTKKYIKSGGLASLSDYYRSGYDHIIMDDRIRRRIVWAAHNLVTDYSFGEMNLIICRNVLIYFSRSLQDSVLEKFSESLVRGGFLCLGHKESLDFSRVRDAYADVAPHERIYQKKTEGRGAWAASVNAVLPERKEGGQCQGIVAIGCSFGGMEALRRILGDLPADFPYPVLITQHISPSLDSHLAEILQNECALTVKEARDGDRICPGSVYVAPADYHMLVDDELLLSLSSDERVSHARPSIDVMFESLADACAPRVTGVILTGANDDGAHGAARLKACGGYLIVQDPSTALAAAMPAAVLAATSVDQVLPLEQIAGALVRNARRQGGVKSPP